MITLGANYGGLNHDDSVFAAVLSKAMGFTITVCGPHNKWEGMEPSFNLVFYIPGSIRRFDTVSYDVRVERFSRKMKLILIITKVPIERLKTWTESTEYIRNSLQRANVSSDEVFRTKNVSGYSVERHNRFIDQIAFDIAAKGSTEGKM